MCYSYGAKRIRTADPFNAIEVLYQLSYNPLDLRPFLTIYYKFLFVNSKWLKIFLS